jgi:hypothetical protein
VRANVYVDGFNLYYGAVKKTPYKWLNIDDLCRRLLKGDTINRIRYFTARVQAEPADPDKPSRQQLYLRALATIPRLSIHFGQFLSHPVWAPLATAPSVGPKVVRVIKTEEKGSDVNLATWLLLDAIDGDYELAVVISNDSDLVEPIHAVRQRLGLTVGVLNPHKKPSVELHKSADFIRPIRRGAVASSQFAPTLTDAQGTFSKPASW